MKLSMTGRLGVLLGAALACACAAAATPGLWTTDYSKALQTAAKESKYVLLDFGGSDWCPACKLLSKSVFSKREFLEFARRRLVLVEVDFPENTPQSPALQQANRKLAGQFNAEAFPTVIVVDARGREVFREEGYEGLPVADYIAHLKKVMK